MKLTTVPVKSYLSVSKIPGAGYVINPYVGCPHKCLYCYAEFMRKFTGHTEPWGEFLDIKLCESPLNPAQLFHQHVMLSSVTDAYNPFEKKYQLTRRILEQLVACRAQVSVLTKSALVVRDIDLLKQLPGCEVTFSFSTVDEQVRTWVEPGACSVSQRLEAMEKLHRAGIPVGVMAAPLLPGISDFKEIVNKCKPFTRVFRFDSLNMRATFQRKWMDFIDVHFPHLLPLYNQIYLQKNRTYWQQLTQDIGAYAQEHCLDAEVLFGKESSFSFTTRQETMGFPPPDQNDPQPQLF